MSRTRRATIAAISMTALLLRLPAAAISADDATPDASPADGMMTMDPMDQGLVVKDPWTRASMMLDLANAVYLVVHNGGDADDALIGASSPAAEVVEIHQTSRGDDGTMAMAPVTGVPIPAHGDAVLEPGGYHIMLMGLQEALEPGAQIELTLEFRDAEPRTLLVPVTQTGPMSEMDMGDDMDMGDAEEEADAT